MGAVGYFLIPNFASKKYVTDIPIADSIVIDESATENTQILSAEIQEPSLIREVVHVPTPESVKAIYMTSWIAGNKELRAPIIKILKETEINAVVIDIKDDTGRIAFIPKNQMLIDTGSPQNRINDIETLIDELHKEGIYIIGRVAVFQDPYLTKKWTEEALKKKSNPAELWGDRKGLFWFDAGSKKVHDYIFTIAEEAYTLGFDEINFDYIRFPSDGLIRDISYPYSQDVPRRDVMKTFFSSLHERMKELGIPHSADIFGMTAVATDDLGIGQVLEDVLPYFDYVALMVYPSHFPDTWNGLANPAEHPYEVIFQSMGSAYTRVEATGENPDKLRAWIQDFDLGATYGDAEVRDQIRALDNLSIDSWLVWNPRNVYSQSAFLAE